MKKILVLTVAVMVIMVSGIAYAGDTTLYFLAQPIAEKDQQFSHTLYGAEVKYEDGEKGSISASYLAESSDTRGNSVYGFEAEIPLSDTWQAGVGLERRKTNFDNVINEYATATVKVGFKW